MAAPLFHLINLLMEGICPSIYKIAIIRPIHKSVEKQITSNYLPISVINNYANIFEKILKSRIELFLRKNDLLSGNQFQITALVKSKPCIFLDLAKAFDTVDHAQLFDTLQEEMFRN